MAAKPGQKTFHAEVDAELHDALMSWIAAHKDPPQKQCIAASVELFLSLPEPVQAMLMICHRNSPFFSAAAKIAEQAITAVWFSGQVDEVLAERTVNRAREIEAGTLDKTAGTAAKSKRSGKSRDRKTRKMG